MITIKIIVAVDQNHGIGYKGDLLFKSSQDLKKFRELTENNIIIMGRKTLESLPGGKPLPNRTNIVLTRDKTYQNDLCEVVNDIDELPFIRDAYDGVKDVYVVGGGEIYEKTLDMVNTCYITKIYKEFDADTYFSNLDTNGEWELTDQSELHNENGVDFRYLTYERVE